MANNSIENNTIKNSEINQTINMFFGFQDLPPEAIKQLKEMYPDEFKNSKEGEIKKEIEKLYKDSYDKYIDTVTKLVQCNYIYVLYNGKYIGNIFLYLYQNYGEDLKSKVEKILKEVLKTKLSFDLHIGILINMINNLKSVQFTKILDNIYINKWITDIINMIIENIQNCCSNLKLDYKEYEKYITKESGGIELKPK